MGEIEKPPIEKILEHYGAPFVPTGNSWRRMKCPFQEGGDRNPSASVNTLIGRFRCFSCDVNEDAYGIIQWREGFNDFPSAKQFIEDLLGRSFGELPHGFKDSRRNGRRGVFEESRPAMGQRTIVPSRGRRKPFAGA